jgi:hypothetical protein
MISFEVRNECYPSWPQVSFKPSKGAYRLRRTAADTRNARISMGGAQRAVDAANGGPIGAAKTGKGPK